MKKSILIILMGILLIPSSAGSWGVVGISGGVDSVAPDQFTFNDATECYKSTEFTSNTITIADVSGTVNVSVTGGTYSKNAGAYTGDAGTCANGDTFTLKQTSSSSNATKTDCVLTVDGGANTWSITTGSNSLSADQLVTAGSCSADSTYTTYVASNAIDNDAYFWNSATGGTYDTHWWQYDLGADYAHHINYVCINNYSPYDPTKGGIKGFKLQGSNNGSSFTDITGASGSCADANNTCQAFTFHGNTTIYRYIRLIWTNDSTSGCVDLGAYITEIEAKYDY